MSYVFQDSFPGCRMSRHDFIRRLDAENQLTVNDLIYPVFVMEGNNRQEQVATMPDVSRMTIDLLIKEAEIIAILGVPVISLFTVVEPGLKSLHVEEFYNPDGLVQRSVHALERRSSRTGHPD